MTAADLDPLRVDSPRPLVAHVLGGLGLPPLQTLVLLVLCLDLFPKNRQNSPSIDQLAQWTGTRDISYLAKELSALARTHPDWLRIDKRRGHRNRYTPKPPPPPDDAPFLPVSEPRPLVSEVSLLPPSWCAGKTQRLVLYVAAIASTDGRTFTLSTPKIASAISRNHSHVKAAIKALREPVEGVRPPLLSILESGRGKAEATTYQLLLPASHRPTDRLDFHPGDRPTDRPTDRLDSYHRDRLDSSGSTLIALSLSPAPSKSDDPEHLEAQQLLSDYHQQELRSACSLADLMAAAYHLDRDGLTSSAQRIIDTLSGAIAQAEKAKKAKRTAAITALRGLVSQ